MAPVINNNNKNKKQQKKYITKTNKRVKVDTHKKNVIETGPNTSFLFFLLKNTLLSDLASVTKSKQKIIIK
jgi:hypothetical protein